MSLRIFEQYEEDFVSVCDRAQRLISESSSAKGEPRKDLLRRAERETSSLQEMLSSMAITARDLPPSDRSACQSRLSSHKERSSRLRSELQKARVSTGFERDELLAGGGTQDYHVTSMDQRTRLLASTDRLNDHTTRISQTQRTLAQTEELGVNVLGNLHEQRGKLENARDNLIRADENVGRSGRVLRTMARRMMTNKLIMALIILILIAVIVLIVYFKWIKKPAKKGASGSGSSSGSSSPSPVASPTSSSSSSVSGSAQELHFSSHGILRKLIFDDEF